MTTAAVPDPTGGHPRTLEITTAPAVVRALLEGEILVDIRPAGDPTPQVGERFWLIPGDRDPELKPAYRITRDLAPASDERVIGGWAELVASGSATLDADRLAALGSKTVISLEALAGADVVVLSLRTYRLAAPVPAVGISDLPADPMSLPSVPALSAVAFDAKRQGVADALA